jgi:hypothetical protein
MGKNTTIEPPFDFKIEVAEPVGLLSGFRVNNSPLRLKLPPRFRFTKATTPGGR